jgi:4-hydroxybenzoate polyprenyltransferase
MNNSTIKSKGAFRIKDWWGKASLLMGMIYLFTARYHISFEKLLPLAVLSLITIAGFASMGYLFNDLFDIKTDAIAGKRNFLAGKQWFFVIGLFLLSATFVFGPWLYLPNTRLSFILIAVQILLFVLYSAPPVRLKERGMAGIITDALYAHGLPTFLAAYTYALAADFVFPTADIFILFTWQVLAGVRNILIHQADDLDADKKSGSKNFVARLTASKFQSLLKWFTLVELALGAAFFGFLLTTNAWFALCLVVILTLSVADYSFFTEADTGQFLKSTWKFFPNNIYEKWLPVAYLTVLAIGDLRFIILLLIHIAVFNFDFYAQVAIKIYGRWQSIPFKGYLILVRIFLSYPINYFIYYLLRIFGVDLKKENMSAAAYLKKKLGRAQ